MKRLHACWTALRDPAIARLIASFFLFGLAEMITWTGTLVYGYRAGGAFAVGILGFAVLIPGILVAPLASYCGDRFERVKVLVVSYLAIAAASAITGALVQAETLVIPTCIGAAVVATLMTLPRPTMGAILPAVVKGGDTLTAANVAVGLAKSSALACGPAISALVLLTGNLALLFYLPAGMTVVAAALARSVPSRRELLNDDEHLSLGDARRETFAGLALIRRDPTTRVLLTMLMSGPLLMGFLDVSGVVVALDVLHQGEAYAGWFASATGLGSLVGASLALMLIGLGRVGPTLVIATAAQGLPLLLLLSGVERGIALLAFGLCGIGIALGDVAGQTLLQRVTPNDVMARVYGVLEGLIWAAFAAGALGFSLLSKVLSVPATVAAGTGFLVLLALVMSRSVLVIDRNRKPPDETLMHLLRNLAIFAPLPAQSLERLAQVAIRRTPEPGTEVIREGQPGYSLFLIEKGSVKVSRGGVAVATLTAPDVVGEVALLDDTPRNATAEVGDDEAVLWEIDRDHFIQAVIGYPRAEARSRAFATGRRPDSAVE